MSSLTNHLVSVITWTYCIVLFITLQTDSLFMLLVATRHLILYSHMILYIFVGKEIRLKMVTNVYYIIYKIKIIFTCVQRFVICMSHCMFQSTHSNLSPYKTVLTNAQISAWINYISHIELVAKSITQSVHLLLTMDHLAYTSEDEQLGCPLLPGLAVFAAEE